MSSHLLWPIFAQIYREDFGRGFRGATSQLHWTDFLPYIAAFVLITGGWALYVHLKRRNDMTARCDDPHKLFRELCLAHQLDRASRRLLLQLAAAWNFSQPAQVFLTPAAFEPSRLPADLRGRMDEVKQLRARLF
jgi:hypothetical protein